MRANRFTDRVMVITGAAQGIGMRVAQLAGAEGAKLVLVDRAEHVHTVLAELREQGVDAIAVQVNLEAYRGAEQALRQARKHYGRIDILINNVGGTMWAKPYAEYRPKEIQAEIRRSLFPTLWSCHAVLPHMLEQRGGVIVNVSSVATRGLNRVPYGACKGGVNSITVNLAWEYAEHNIRVNATAPGATDAPPRVTPRNAPPQTEQEKGWFQRIYDQSLESSLMRRMGSLDEQAHAILFLASDEASFITGTILPVAGGDPG